MDTTYMHDTSDKEPPVQHKFWKVIQDDALEPYRLLSLIKDKRLHNNTPHSIKYFYEKLHHMSFILVLSITSMSYHLLVILTNPTHSRTLFSLQIPIILDTRPSMEFIICSAMLLLTSSMIGMLLN